MRRRFVSVRLDPFYFCFEQIYPFIELIYRIWRQVFGCQPAGGIAFRAGKIVVHWRKIAMRTACCQWEGGLIGGNSGANVASRPQ